MKNDVSILFLGKTGDFYVKEALDFCRLNFTDVKSHLGQWGDELPADLESWDGHYIISYLSRWLVPQKVLNRAKIAAINFHPASPDYPGIGCNNFALYEGASEYGVTCHHMASKVDTGNIIAVKRFPVFETDNVATLLKRTYAYQLVLFYETIGVLLKGGKLPTAEETWSRSPFSRKDFNSLMQINVDMSAEEIDKRVRATNFGEWKPTVNLNGFVFELQTKP
jgi:methionyl-tRNA formyltransferase